MNNLKQRTVNGILWTTTQQLSYQGVQLIVTIILARLLEPAQFGLIGMLMLFIGLAQSILDSGFGSALIQKKDADQTDYCSVFYFNILIGILLVGVLFFSAPLIAKFYNQPILIGLTRLLSINVLINSFALIQSTLLIKEMNFKAQFKVNLVSVVLSGFIGVTLAYLGFGVWSLGIQSVINTLIRTILLWLINKWRPELIFSLSRLKTMFTFGSKLLISGLLNTFFDNIYLTVIGKVFSVSVLGFYTRALTMQQTVVSTTSSSLGQVMFPALIPINDNTLRLKQVYQKTIQVSALFHFPIMIGLCASADPIIRLLMTDKWAPSIPIFQLLCISGLLYPLHVLNLNILKVKGRSDLFLKLEVYKKLVIIIAIVGTIQWGLITMLYGQIATSLICYLLNSFYSGRLINYGLLEQIRDIIPTLLIAIIMGVIIYLINNYFNINQFLMIVIDFIVGSFVYLILNILIKSPALAESTHIIRSIFSQLYRQSDQA